jgi:hypothetical protein
MGGIVIMFLAAAVAASPVPSLTPSPARHMPTWEDEIAQGHLPYHQLTVDDFPDRNETFRDPRFREMKAYLPYAQAILDLNQLYARQLGVVPPEGFPENRAGTDEEALAGLQEKIHALCQHGYAGAERETEAFVKATRTGDNKKKTRQLAAEISQRLKAMPAPTPFGASTAPAPSVTPAPTSSPASTAPGNRAGIRK